MNARFHAVMLAEVERGNAMRNERQYGRMPAASHRMATGLSQHVKADVAALA